MVLDEHLHIMPVAAFLFGIGAFGVTFVFHNAVQIVELNQFFDIVD